MAEEKKEKILYIATHGGENPEKASLPFVLANAAQAMEVEAVVVLQGPAVFLAKKDICSMCTRQGFHPFRNCWRASWKREEDFWSAFHAFRSVRSMWRI